MSAHDHDHELGHGHAHHEGEQAAPLHFDRHAGAGVTRRSALAAMAASMALASGACSRLPRERIYPWVDMREGAAGELPVYYATAYVRDGHAMGVRVGTRDGRPIKVEGNPLHPSSLGATDVFAQASVLELWDPDRSSAVLQRLGSAHAGAAPVAAASSWQAFETAWRGRATRLANEGGAGFRLLTGPISSPTLRAQIGALLARLPHARWHQHAPLDDVAAASGARAAFGRRVQPVLHLDRARTIVALAADPFSDGPGAVRHAADWARRRANERDRGGELPRLFAAEISSGLFGARADTHFAAAPGAIDDVVRRIAAQIVDGSDAAVDRDAGVTAAFATRAADALRAAGSDALVVPGAPLSASSHAAVHAIHRRLGAHGRTLDLIAPLAMSDDAGTLAELVDAIDAGAVDTLLVLDANPVYDAPAASRFAAVLGKVRTTIHAGLHRDETARAALWHLPLAHDYERWGDALAHDGSATLVQPAIAPLYAGRSPIELLALIGGDEERDGHRLLQRQWRGSVAAGDFEAFWADGLARGVIADSAAAPLMLLAARGAATAATPSASVPAANADATLVAVFASDPSVHDGRFANNAWLQELPRPHSKMTWDNALLVGPKTAAAARLENGIVARVTVAGRALEAPVWVSAAHAEGAITLPLGYGRRDAGRVGSGVGFDAYAVRPVDAWTAAATIERVRRSHDFAVTQHAISQEGRDLARTLAPGERMADPGERHASLYPDVANPEHAWAMAIDLDACIGCNACTIACQAENNIPVVGRGEVAKGREMHWIRVDRYETPDVAGSIFQPVPCMHCEKAPCELVCPVGATVHDSEGLNVQVYNRCVGTRFCSNNCPYKVRRFNFLQYSDTETETLKAQRNPNVTVRQRGVMEKCTYCLQRIARARQQAETSGGTLADGDVVTACQAVCPTSAIRFGDLRDANSDVVRAKASPRHYALLGELDTRPRTTYLARVVPPPAKGHG